MIQELNRTIVNQNSTATLSFAAKIDLNRSIRLSGKSCCWLLLFCMSLSAASPLEVQVLNADGQAVGGFVVYLQARNTPSATEAPQSGPTIKQEDKTFSPYITVMQKGSDILFTNLDDITHHIYSVAGSSSFSFKLRLGATKSDLDISQTGVFGMGCNLHDWMTGYLLVVDTPYFAMTDSDGKTTLQVDSPGQYRVIAWHPQMNEQLEQQITLPLASTLTLKLRRKMAEIPLQKPIDDFDFLERY